jgi:uncharacterized repeat protein (TIGR04076 family)
MPVRITVIKGECQGGFHQKGDEFIVDWKTPGGMCLGAWDPVSSYVTALLCGATKLPDGNDPDAIEIHCSDPKGITMQVRRIP